MNKKFVSLRPLGTAKKIALSYLLLAILWICFSDKAILFFFTEAGALTTAQTYKGWFFVSITAFALFVLLEREIRRHTKSEEALRANEQYLGSILRAAPTGIGVVKDRVLLAVNDRICAMTGYSRTELIGQSARILYPDNAEYELVGTEKYNQISKHGTGTVETRWQCKNGGILDVLLSSAPINPQELGEGVTFTALDITESKKMETALRESEEKFALAFDDSPDAVNINRLEDGLFVEINRGFTDLTGYTREEVSGRTSLEIDVWHDPADRALLIQHLREKGYCENIEAVFRRKDGSLATGLMSARVILLNKTAHILSITRDITQRKQDAANLERLRIAIEHATEVIVITDAEGTIQYANPSFEKVTGYTIAEACQQNPRILKSGEHDEAFFTELWNTIASGQTWSGRLVNRKKDGSLYTEEATISPVFNSQGTIVNYVGIKRDITAQLKLETQYLQAQKMESVGRLTGGVAHDFNNILSVILGYTEMALAQTDSTQHLHSYLKKIYDAGNRSADIVRQLLAFSRKQTIAPRVLDLNETVAGMLKMLHRMIGENVELTWIPAPDISLVKMDPAQIDQILVNLCVNARDAVDGNGKIAIATKTVNIDKEYCLQHEGCLPGRYVMLSVRDSGCGMDRETITQIFEPFFTTKGVGRGTGLGLATVYGIVKQNNGSIDVISEPGEGTTFRIHLPLHQQEAMGSAPEATDRLEMSRGETILLVEDDPLILEISLAMLERLGYRVLSTERPDKALLLAEEHIDTIDLLLTDMIMPGMNGKELAMQLLARSPALKLLYMSGYTADVIGHHGVLDEGVNFLQKPFSINALSVKIREVLDGQPANKTKNSQ